MEFRWKWMSDCFTAIPICCCQEGLVDPKTKAPLPPRTWSELREYSRALTRYRRAGDKSSGITRLGFAPNFGTTTSGYTCIRGRRAVLGSWITTLTKVTMDTPANVCGLRFMTDCYDLISAAFQPSMACR